MKTLVINLKMNHTVQDTIIYEKKLSEICNGYLDVIVCPQAPFIQFYNKGIFSIGAQDVSYYSGGNHTGEISAKALSSLDVDYCMVGHSERRITYHEGNEILINKIKNAFEQDMGIILFVGESRENKKNPIEEVEEQVVGIFNKLPTDIAKNILIVYEPVWAIDDASPASNDTIGNVSVHIKKILKRHYNVDARVLYGGGVNDFNINSINTIESIDGVVVSDAALDINKLKIIVDDMTEKDY